GALPDVNIPRHEIAGLPGEYAPPSGALLIAMDGEAAAGCVALRRLGKDTCEMKRLFVRPNYRGQEVGKRLVHEIIARAQDLGYARMLLDSRPSMQAAIRLYRSVGFREIASYMKDPVPGALFFELELTRIAHASG
ncbi:MAG TPA: GNAT family N-acetyltransferase, partial [Candidatus Acidoferrales bacterium]|nr:GNAT family N-acetyltransferase [Candidatus Acidoferrales bacterium]